MRRLIFVLAVGLAAGCGGGDNQKPENQQPPPQAQPKAQPQPQAQPQPKPKPAQPANTADASDDDGPIVIKGSRKSSSSSTPSSSGRDDDANRKKIEELNAKAKATQGQDNGAPYREDAGTPASGSDAAAQKKQELKDRIAAIDTQIKQLQDEKAGMAHRERVDRYSTDTKYDDPERAKQIDQQVADLKTERDLCQKRIFDIDNPAPRKGGGTTTPGQPPAGGNPPPPAGDQPK